MNKLHIDKPANMEDEDFAPNTYTADQVGMGRKSAQYTIFQYTALLQEQHSAHIATGSAVPMQFAQYPHLPFCVLIYLNL